MQSWGNSVTSSRVFTNKHCFDDVHLICFNILPVRYIFKVILFIISLCLSDSVLMETVCWNFCSFQFKMLFPNIAKNTHREKNCYKMMELNMSIVIRRLELLMFKQALLDSSNILFVLFTFISRMSFKESKTVPDASSMSSSSGTVSLCQGSGGEGLIIILVLFRE